MSSPTVRPFSAEEWQAYRALRLGALADSPNAFGSLLEYEQPRSDEDWAIRLATGVGSPSDLPLLAEVGGVPTGLAWGRADPAD